MMETKKITPAGFTEEQRQRILDALHSDKRYNAMKDKRDKLLKARRYVEAANLTAQLRQLEKKTLEAVAEAYEEERVALSGLLDEFTPEERLEAETNLHGIVFLSDIIDTMIRRVEELLQRHQPECRIVTYDKLKQLQKAVAKHIDLVLNGAPYRLAETYADYAEAVEAFVLKKTSVFVKKQQKIMRNEQQGKQRKNGDKSKSKPKQKQKQKPSPEGVPA